MAHSILQVIIVEDEKADARLAEHMLRQCRILNPISLFGTGQAFLEYLSELSADGLNTPHEPSLLLLDLVMPNMGGLDVLAALQSAPYAKYYVPVMLSGLTDMKLVNLGYQLGAKTFLLKPLTQGAVSELLKSLSDRIAVKTLSDGYMLQWNAQDLHVPATANNPLQNLGTSSLV